jgi:hypothetical protein
MGDSASKRVHHQRRRKHPYRRFLRILLGALLVISLFFLMQYLRRSPATPGPVAPSGGDNQVQFH